MCGLLLRFAQFFINPLMSADATMREIKAVDSGQRLCSDILFYFIFYTQVVILITVNFYCVFGVIENQKNLLSDGWRMNQVELASDYSLYMTANAESY